jgi:hypothetical protein
VYIDNNGKEGKEEERTKEKEKSYKNRRENDDEMDRATRGGNKEIQKNK